MPTPCPPHNRPIYAYPRGRSTYQAKRRPRHSGAIHTDPTQRPRRIDRGARDPPMNGTRAPAAEKAHSLASRQRLANRPADRQSADGSGSLQLPLLFSRPALRAAACGGRPRPAAPRRHPGNPASASTPREPKQPRGWQGRAEPWTSRTRGPQQTVMSAGFQVRAEAAGLRRETAEVALGSPSPPRDHPEALSKHLAKPTRAVN
jgi:hypothetical protein